MNEKSLEPKYCVCCKQNKIRKGNFDHDSSRWDFCSPVCRECLSTGRSPGKWRIPSQRYQGRTEVNTIAKKLRTEEKKRSKK